jgi:hypothetical protein
MLPALAEVMHCSGNWKSFSWAAAGIESADTASAAARVRFTRVIGVSPVDREFEQSDEENSWGWIRDFRLASRSVRSKASLRRSGLPSKWRAVRHNSKGRATISYHAAISAAWTLLDMGLTHRPGCVVIKVLVGMGIVLGVADRLRARRRGHRTCHWKDERNCQHQK